ncbi:MAG: TldD/PmbA family protein, partial [Nitrospirae bacterium]|nr:TldD/PmbA family protein [Nitrospirota bacterium]
MTHRTDFHDTRILRTTGLSILIDNGEIREISESFHQGAVSRALVGGSWALYTSDNPEDADKILDFAVTLAGRTHLKSPRADIELASVEPSVVHDLPKVEKDPGDISIEEKVDLLLEIHKRAKLPDITSTSVVYSGSLVNVEYFNSE